jgi:8-oxo-dGTP diphosphatase
VPVHMEKNPTLLTVVALALIDEAGCVLMQRRPEHRAHGGLWEFPGGKVELGEGPCAALVREIDEELGLVIAIKDLFPISFAAREPTGSDSLDERPLVLLLYGCRRWEGTPACEPGAALVWAVPAELATLAMPPLDVPLLAALQRHEKMS